MKKLTSEAFVTFFPDVCFSDINQPNPEVPITQYNHRCSKVSGIFFIPFNTPALQTNLMSSLPVYCVVFYFISRVNIWTISASLALLSSVWDCRLERAMLEITSDNICAGFILPNVLLQHSALCLNWAKCCPDDPSNGHLHIHSLQKTRKWPGS